MHLLINDVLRKSGTVRFRAVPNMKRVRLNSIWMCNRMVLITPTSGLVLRFSLGLLQGRTNDGQSGSPASCRRNLSPAPVSKTQFTERVRDAVQPKLMAPCNSFS